MRPASDLTCLHNALSYTIQPVSELYLTWHWQVIYHFYVLPVVSKHLYKLSYRKLYSFLLLIHLLIALSYSAEFLFPSYITLVYTHTAKCHLSTLFQETSNDSIFCFPEPLLWKAIVSYDFLPLIPELLSCPSLCHSRLLKINLNVPYIFTWSGVPSCLIFLPFTQMFFPLRPYCKLWPFFPFCFWALYSYFCHISLMSQL